MREFGTKSSGRFRRMYVRPKGKFTMKKVVAKRVVRKGG